MALSLRSGIAGAATLAALNQLAQHNIEVAPRLATPGRRGLARAIHAAGLRPAAGRRRVQALGAFADVLSAALFYGLVGRSRRPLLRGAALGALAGYGALRASPSRYRSGSHKSREARNLTLALYVLGGVAAGLAARRALA